MERRQSPRVADCRLLRLLSVPVGDSGSDFCAGGGITAGAVSIQEENPRDGVFVVVRGPIPVFASLRHRRLRLEMRFSWMRTRSRLGTLCRLRRSSPLLVTAVL